MSEVDYDEQKFECAGPFDIDNLIRFCSKNGKKEATEELLEELMQFANNAELSLKEEYDEQNESMNIENAKPYLSIKQVRLLWTQEPTKDNLDSVTYVTELKLGLEKGLDKFPSNMGFPGGYVVVIYALTYKTCLLVDQYKLYQNKMLSDKDFWDCIWLFFEDLNCSPAERDVISAKQNKVLEICEERSRRLHSSVAF